TLSKGYRQRVGLADALIADPPLLILDEPTDGLDPEQKLEALNLLRDLGKNHTIMLSSHMLTEVESIVQRIIILRRGMLGLARKLSELDTDSTIVMEVRAPQDQVLNLIKSLDGVAAVVAKDLGEGVFGYEVRPERNQDLREALAQRMMRNGHVL